jgi:hypothetical protein
VKQLTHAPQQTASSLDNFVGAGEKGVSGHRENTIQTVRFLLNQHEKGG